MIRTVLSSLSIVFLLPCLIIAAELTILTEDLPPLNYLRDGKLVGPSVEIVREIQKRVGSTAEIQVMPWARAYKIALEQANVVLFGTTQTEARKDVFKWAGALSTKRDILLARKDRSFQLTSLEDAKRVSRIGTLREDTREILLQSYGFKNLESVPNEQKNARKLLLGRIELWAYKTPGFKTVCDLAGVDHRLFEEVYHLRKIDVSIAFSSKTPDSIVDKWRAAYSSLESDGTLERIRAKWGVD